MRTSRRDHAPAVWNRGLTNVSDRVKSDAYDADLYHRALTGRGAPITGPEVIALLETMETWLKDHEDNDAARQKAEEKLEEAWIVPQEEPMRPCELCRSGHDRGDGRCENHGRLVPDPEPILIAASRGRGGRRPPVYEVFLDVPEPELAQRAG